MPNKDPNINNGIIDVFLIAIAVLFAMAGGITKYLADVQESKTLFSWVGLGIQAMISAFSGSIVTLWMMDQGYSTLMILLGAGLFGFGGVAILRVVMKKLHNHLGESEAKNKGNE